MSQLNVGKIITSDISISNAAGGLSVPMGTTAQRPATPTAGTMRWNTDTDTLEFYNGEQWDVLASAGGADSGGGGGFSIAQGADGANVIGYTNNSMTQYKLNNSNQGASDSGTALSYNSGCGSFAYHDGHQVPAWWPMYHVIKVTDDEKGKVLNSCDWYTHVNAIGNVDFFGSNQDITGANYTTEALWTHLGRAHFGGAGGGGSDCTVYTRNFNPNSYGYKWYMLKGVDNSSSPVAYPSVGSQGGWAMYRMRLNKI